jgi:hypothetical protein
MLSVQLHTTGYYAASSVWTQKPATGAFGYKRFQSWPNGFGIGRR